MKKNILNYKKNLLNTYRKYQKKISFDQFDFNRIKIINDKIFKFSKKISQVSRDKFETNFKTNQEEVVLRQSVVWAQRISSTLIGGTIFGVLWLTFAKTEEIAIVAGALEPISGVIDVQMPTGGVAEIIYIKEGDQVRKGDLLIKLDTESNEGKLEALRDSYEVNKDILSRLKNLVENGAVSEIQYLNQKTKIADIKSKLIENEVLLKYQKILSPTDGMVFDLKAKGPGFVARSSEPVLKIVPQDNLQAKIEIQSNKIGFVNIGKKVDISIDSFPASDFGVVKGEVISIGSDALPPDPSLRKGYRFPATIKLDNQRLKIKGNKTLPLQTGMSITANIKLRSVSYLQLLLNNFQDKADSLRSL